MTAREQFGPRPQTLEDALVLIDRLFAVIEAQAARIEELERRLDQGSKNSSKPPSSDSPEARAGRKKDKKRKDGGRRRRGGQAGHKGHQRELVPADRVDHVEDYWPEACHNCHHDFCDDNIAVEVDGPDRHQGWELPRVQAEVTEHRLHWRWCPDCEHATRADLPPGVPQGAFGPRLEGALSLLTSAYRLSKRSAQSLLRDFFGAYISLGAVKACERRTSAAVAPAVVEAHEHVQEQSVVNADETGWYEGERRERAWLWVAVTSQVTVFMIHARRSAEAADKLLGRFAGVLCTDRWSAYTKRLLKSGQICWAHLRRDFTFFSERTGEARVIGGALLLAVEEIFKYWHRVRDGTMARSTFQRKMRPIQRGVEDLLRDGTVCGHAAVAGKCRDILRYQSALWTFVRKEGVEPTNNAAERAVRHGVILRKTSFGTHAESGSRFVERMLTVVATLRQQDRNVLDYVTEACDRRNHGLPPRSLLPSAHLLPANP